MNVELTFPVTKQFRETVARRMLRSVHMWLFFGLLVFMFIIIFATDWSCDPACFPSPFVWVAAAFVTALCLLLCWLGHRKAVGKAVASQSKWGEFQMVYRITDEGVQFRSPYVSGDYPWRMFERLRRFPDVWFLYVNRLAAFTIPADKVTGEVGDFIARKVRENGGKVK
jgi:hypothetical protein